MACLIAPIPFRPYRRSYSLVRLASCADPKLIPLESMTITSSAFLDDPSTSPGSASESPASEAYPSTTSPSPHRSSPSTSLGNTYEEVASKQFEATDMSGQGRVSTNFASTTQPFSTEGNYGSHHFGQQGGVRSSDMGETWYGECWTPRQQLSSAIRSAKSSTSPTKLTI